MPIQRADPIHYNGAIFVSIEIVGIDFSLMVNYGDSTSANKH